MTKHHCPGFGRQATRSWAVGVVGLVLVLVAAEDPTQDAIREGNRAMRRVEFDRAEALYTQAAERTPDPGLVAFNMAVLARERGDFRTAELLLARVLEDQDASRDRRIRAQYNRGVCLLARGGSTTVLRSAIHWLEQAQDLTSFDDPLRPDIEHNLELAKLRWNQSRAREQNPPKPNQTPPDVPEPLDPDRNRGGASDPDPAPEIAGKSDAAIDPLTGRAGAATPRPTPHKAPGAGSLPVQLDDANTVQPLTPEDTRALLQRLAERLEADRKQTARLVAGPERPHVRDW